MRSIENSYGSRDTSAGRDLWIREFGDQIGSPSLEQCGKMHKPMPRGAGSAYPVSGNGKREPGERMAVCTRGETVRLTPFAIVSKRALRARPKWAHSPTHLVLTVYTTCPAMFGK